MRRDHVASTLIRRHFNVVCPLGYCQLRFSYACTPLLFLSYVLLEINIFTNINFYTWFSYVIHMFFVWKFYLSFYMSLNVRKCTIRHVSPAKTQISLHIRDVWSESSLSAWRNFASLAIENAAPSEDSDWTVITKTRLFKYIENFTTKKRKFSNKKKKPDIFHISAQNIDYRYTLEPLERGGSNEYPQSMFFFSKIRKNNVYPCKPQFYYIKVEFKGVKII